MSTQSRGPARRLSALLVLFCFAGIACAQQQSSANEAIGTSSFRPIYATDWRNGLDPKMSVQRAREEDISVVSDPTMAGRKALRVHIEKSEDFKRVANGSPRAEVLLPPAASIAPGHDYLIQWSTFLPANVEFDEKQMEIITQIHQGDLSGPPPFMLTLTGQDYTVSERGGNNTVYGHGALIRHADADRARWVNWTLRYTPDATGHHAATSLLKDGVEVFASRGLPNAYPGEQSAYLKLGVYKPGWQSLPTSVSTIELLFGSLSIAEH
jgi:hypothetical protein